MCVCVGATCACKAWLSARTFQYDGQEVLWNNIMGSSAYLLKVCAGVCVCVETWTCVLCLVVCLCVCVCVCVGC